MTVINEEDTNYKSSGLKKLHSNASEWTKSAEKYEKKLGRTDDDGGEVAGGMAPTSLAAVEEGGGS